METTSQEIQAQADRLESEEYEWVQHSPNARLTACAVEWVEPGDTEYLDEWHSLSDNAIVDIDRYLQRTGGVMRWNDELGREKGEVIDLLRHVVKALNE